MNITTTEELRDYLHNIEMGETSVSVREAATSMVRTLEAVFAGWEEDTMGALLVDVGMILGTRRGPGGVECLAKALDNLRVLLTYREQQRRRMN